MDLPQSSPPKPRPKRIGRGQQLELEVKKHTWGGSRRGAGRKPVGRSGVSHNKRPALASRFPVHVSYTVSPKLPSLRSPQLRRVIEGCFRRIDPQGGIRLVHYSIQRHHLHLIVEAQHARALSRGMQSLSIRIAKAINTALGRKGRVFIDRYYEKILKNPRQTRHCLVYVLNNARKHDAQRGYVRDPQWLDPCSSALYFNGWERPVRAPPGVDPPVSPPGTWLLIEGWDRHGKLKYDEVPGGQDRRRKKRQQHS